MLERSRYRGALLGALVGDVLGAPFEGHAGLVPAAALASSLGASSALPFTDDTALTIALAESLLGVGGFDEEDLGRSFADAWAAAPELGYSTRTAAVLRSIHAAGRWSGVDIGHGRASNGAAMRVTPVPLWTAGRRTDTVELARRSARVTHDHPGAVEGAVAQAVGVAAALHHPAGEPIDAVEFVAAVRAAVSDPLLVAKLDVAAALSRHGDADQIVERIGVSLLVSESVPAATCAFLSHPASFADAVTLAISLGGDADTVASMTGALCGALLGEASIPRAWLERTALAPRVQHLADALYSVAVRPSPRSTEW